MPIDRDFKEVSLISRLLAATHCRGSSPVLAAQEASGPDHPEHQPSCCKAQHAARKRKPPFPREAQIRKCGKDRGEFVVVNDGREDEEISHLYAPNDHENHSPNDECGVEYQFWIQGHPSWPPSQSTP